MGLNPPHQTTYSSSHVSGNGGSTVLDPPHEHAGAREISHRPLHYATNTRWGVMIFALVVAVALCVVFVLVHRSNSAAEAKLTESTATSSSAAVAVDVVPVTRAGSDKVISLPGNANSFHETTLYARVSGYCETWLHDIGDPVKKDEVLAIIETPELDQQLLEAEAKVAQLKSGVDVALSSAKFAKASYDRWEHAYKDLEGSVSQQERDEKKAELDSDKAKVEAAKSAVNLAEAEVKRLTTLEGFKKVVAPFDGNVTRRDVDYGDLVTAGSNSNTAPLFTISQATQIRIYVDVPEPAMPEIHLGMNATAVAREVPGHVFTGTVTRDSQAVDPQTRMLKVEVLVDNPKLLLLPGMYVQVTFQTSRQNPPLRVPASAMAFSPHGPQVAIVGTDGRVFFHDVTISRDMGDSVELGSGVKEGDLVALNVGNQVVDGEKVDAHRVENAPTKIAPAARSPKPKLAANEPAKAKLGP